MTRTVMMAAAVGALLTVTSLPMSVSGNPRAFLASASSDHGANPTPKPDVGTCDRVLTSGRVAGAVAGETICFKGDVGQIYITHAIGTAGSPITFTNTGGQVLASAVIIEGSEHVRFVGDGTAGVDYGFRVQSDGTGLRATHASTYVEVGWVWIDGAAHGTAIGMGLHTTDGQGAPADFVMRDTWVHHNKITHASSEGMYIGKNPGMGPLLEGLLVEHNVISYTGRDAINVKGTPVGCLVRDNQIDHDTQLKDPGQKGGIGLGDNTRCDATGNTVRDGFGPGIRDIGLGNTTIAGNTIINPGQGWDQPYGYGVWIQASDGGPVYVLDNTVVNPATAAYKLGSRGVLSR